LVSASDLVYYELNDENDPVTLVSETPSKIFSFRDGTIKTAFYTQDLSQILVVCNNGSLFRLPFKAERREDADPEDEDNKKAARVTQVISGEAEIISHHHNSPVLFLEEIKESNRLVSVSINGHVMIHDVSSKKEVASVSFNSKFTCAHINPLGNLLFIGSDKGCLRILDISEPKTPRLVYCKKLHATKALKSLRISHDNSTLGLVFEDSNEVYFTSAQPDSSFEFYGFVALPGTVLDLAWSSAVKSPIDSKKFKHLVEVVVKNGLLAAIVLPRSLTPVPVFKEIPQDDISIRGRRIDFDIFLVAVDNETGDVLCTGEEKVVRRYKQPEELLRDMDLRPRPPFTPIEELDGHDLRTNCISFKEGAEAFVSGGEDGCVIKRSSKDTSSCITIRSQSYLLKGVSACGLSDKYPLVYSAGFDGSILIFKHDSFTFDKDRLRNKEISADLDASDRRPLENLPDADIKYYEVILEEEYHKSQETEKFETQKNMKEKLFVLKQKLKKLLDQNKRAEEIDRIDRDEFCLDLDLRTKMLTEGEKGVEAIKKDAYHKNLSQELLHKKITSNTFSKIDTHLKTITGLVEPTLVFNFIIRKREKAENDKYKMFSNLRMLEITEKRWRKDNKMDEIVDLTTIIGNPENEHKKKDLELLEFLQNYPDAKQIITKPENFICTLKPGKQKTLLLDHAKREEERQRIKAAALEYDKKSDNQDLNQEAPDRPNAAGYRLYRQNRNPRGKKKHPGAQLNKDDNMEGEKDDHTDLELNDDDEDKMGIIFKIKKTFNREFETFFKFRGKEIEKINDLNTLIQEQLFKLKKEEENFKPCPNIIEKYPLAHQPQTHPRTRRTRSHHREVPHQKRTQRDRRKTHQRRRATQSAQQRRRRPESVAPPHPASNR